MGETAKKFKVLSGGRERVAVRVDKPSDLEAEEYLLSCCFLDPAELIPLCQAAKFTRETYYDPKHGILYAAMLLLWEAQTPIGPDTVALALKQSGDLDQVGGYAFLTQVCSRIPTTAQARVFLARVRACWIRRQIIDRADRLKEAAQTESLINEPLGEFLSPHVAWFENALARLANGRGEVYTLSKRISEVRADVAARAQGKEDRSGWVWTGFAGFDDIARDKCLRPFGSMDEDHIVVIGGGSSHGKSVLMRQWAGEALETGQRVLVYTLETSVKGFCRALAASWAGINLLALPRTPKDLLQKFDEHLARLDELADKKLFVFQHEPGTALRTIEDVALHARRWAMQHGAPHLIELDYLQLLTTKKRCNNREQEIAEVMSVWQELIRSELRCVGIGGAQLNEKGLSEMRQVRRDEDGKVIHRMPNRGDLREGQRIYHDADVVEFLYQPPFDCRGFDQSQGDAPMPETWIVQDKRRNGLRGVLRTRFEKPYLRFRELSIEEAASADRVNAGTSGQVPPGQRIDKRDYQKGHGP
jgi:replicative DNA helicase